MQRKSLTLALAVAGAVGLGASAPGFAQAMGGTTHNNTGGAAAAQAGTTTRTDTPQTDATRTPSTRADSTTTTGTMNRDHAAANGQSFDKTGQDAWAETQAKQNKGRISRKAYMDEMSRRWDAVDHSQQGLTPAEVSRLYGNVDSAAGPARTGSGVQPGNMGPGNSKGQ